MSFTVHLAGAHITNQKVSLFDELHTHIHQPLQLAYFVHLHGVFPNLTALFREHTIPRMQAFQQPVSLPTATTNVSRATQVRPIIFCTATSGISRRAALSLAAALFSLQLLPQDAHARPTPKAPLSVSLIPLVRVRDSLGQLSEDVSNGTNGDVRRVVSVLLKGSNLEKAARESGLWLPKEIAEEGERHAREAYEYLDQVVDYFNATGTKQLLKSEQLRFCLKAIDAAAKELDECLAMFDSSAVAEARKALAGPVM